MVKLKYILLIALVSYLINGTCIAQTKSLFNGYNLDGWKTYGTEKWYVKEGLLICESGDDKEYGYLGTLNNYKNFILTLEFKQNSNGNSGVFIRSTVVGTKISGWQVEVAPLGQHTGGIYESYGRGWLKKPDREKEKILIEGAWNTMKIKVQGSNIKTWLNGTEMIDLTDDKIGIGEGAIVLQIHSGGDVKVSWRNIKINEF